MQLLVGLLAAIAPFTPHTEAGAQTSGAADSVLNRKSSQTLPAPTQRILVEGEPPLTEAMVDRIAEFVTYCFEIPLTAADRSHFRSVLIGEWKRNDRAGIAGDLAMLKAAENLANVDPAKRELFRQSTLADGLLDARKRAQSDPDMRWLVSRYEEEHRPLAGAGSVLLTRQAADAFAELACFMAGEARGQKLEPDRKFKDGVARLLVQQWPSMDAAGRRQLAAMPLTVAQLKASWPDAASAQKEQARAQWRRQFGAEQVAQSGKTSPTGKTGNRTSQIYKSGLEGLSEALTRESHKHIGNMMILSNPSFYH
jgi:hypothetical protein